MFIPKYLECGDDMCQHDPILYNWRILNLSVACVEITFQNEIKKALFYFEVVIVMMLDHLVCQVNVLKYCLVIVYLVFIYRC